MNKTINLASRIILIIAFVISVVFQAGLMWFSDDNGGIAMNFILATEAFFGLAVVLALLVFPIDKIIQNPKSVIRPLIAIVAVAVLCVVAYLFSGSTMSEYQLDKYAITSQTERLVETGLILTYVMLFGAIGALVFTSVKNMIVK